MAFKIIDFPMVHIGIVLFLVSVLKCNADEGSPDYKLVMDKLTKELESEDIIQTDLTFEKKENEVLINGKVIQLVDLDNDWKMNIVIFRADAADGEFTKLMSMPEKGVCDMMKSYYKMYFYESIKNYTNAPEPDKCAVTKESYLIKDYPLDSSKFKKFLKPGYYRIVGTLLKDEEEKIKYIFDAHVEENK